MYPFPWSVPEYVPFDEPPFVHPQSVYVQYPVVSVALFPAVHVPVVVTKYPFPHTVKLLLLDELPSAQVISYG